MRAADIGTEWMNHVLTISTDIDSWYVLEYPEFSQALSNANAPCFPTFDTPEECDAAYDAAWDELQRVKRMSALDAAYEEHHKKDEIK